MLCPSCGNCNKRKMGFGVIYDVAALQQSPHCFRQQLTRYSKIPSYPKWLASGFIQILSRDHSCQSLEDSFIYLIIFQNHQIFTKDLGQLKLRKPEAESNHLKATSLVPSIRLGHKHAKIAKTNMAIYIYIYIHTRLVSTVNKACKITKEKRSYDSANEQMLI